MKTVIIDNYDSFTYNLRHIMRELGADVDVLRNDQFGLEDLAAYDKIVLSPGPGIPSEAGLLLDVIRRYAASKPILGVCLGHQAIAEAFGGGLVNLAEVYHGVQTPVKLANRTAEPSCTYTLKSDGKVIDQADGKVIDQADGKVIDQADGKVIDQADGKVIDQADGKVGTDYIFEGLPDEFMVGRYHSWVVDGESLPPCLEVTAISPEGYVMALKHRGLDVHGIQFHPESVLTPQGRQILSNFLKANPVDKSI